MLITRISPLTGKEATMDIPITESQLNEYRTGNRAIQEIFKDLSADQREFIRSGYTPDDWEEIFGETA